MPRLQNGMSLRVHFLILRRLDIKLTWCSGQRLWYSGHDADPVVGKAASTKGPYALERERNRLFVTHVVIHPSLRRLIACTYLALN
jgi:hypothetical protein